jgi:hypothetical protein
MYHVFNNSMVIISALFALNKKETLSNASCFEMISNNKA